MIPRVPAALLVLALAECALAPTPARAEPPDVRVHGLLDLVAAQRSDTHELNKLTRGDSPYDPYGLRVFIDGSVNEHVDMFGQVVLRDGATPYVDGAYVLFTPFPGTDTHLLAGKIPWPIGTYGPRTYSNKNPLIATPLMYQYHTTLLWWEIPPSADVLIANSGNGQYGIDYFGYPMGMGMAVVDDSWWDVGVSAVGSTGPVECSIGITAGTPGWGSTVKDENSGKAIMGRIGLAPTPGLRFGVSTALGPYLVEGLNDKLAPGKTVDGFYQTLGMVDFEFATGYFELRSEGAWNTWQTPTVGDLGVTTGYVEMKYHLPFGAYAAGRLDGIRFSEIEDSNGVKHSWDSNVARWELGAGYRVDRNILMKLVYQHTTMEGRDIKPSLFAAQGSFTF
ncbi:MAG TPA: hypothetical protein VFX78_12215 [Candidatus Eisenbacteria bacterium]|nr:hypothetical protein [Candidatus Eisenbacteria bacterium]